MWLKIRISGGGRIILLQVFTNLCDVTRMLKWSWEVPIVSGVARFLGAQGEESQWPPIKEIINFKNHN